MNWSAWKQYKANLHTHTTNSDGRLSPAVVIDEYKKRNYSILCLTDHNKVTWPWMKYSRSPHSLSMAAIPGNEISYTNHIGSYFSEYRYLGSDEHKALKEIGAAHGIAVLFHPGRYNRSDAWYASLYKQYSHLVGIEAVNRGRRYKDDVKKWDRILSLTMPARPVWGFANDDMHKIKDLGNDFTIFIMPQLSSTSVRHAMCTGNFYFSSRKRLKKRKGTVPRITRIDVNKNTITITAQNYQSIRWISQGEKIAKGPVLNLAEYKTEKYVRAEIKGPGGRTYTQPFGITVLKSE